MATATLESFKAELERLVDKFGQGERTFKYKDYLEDRVRTDFLDPFIRALGWDRDNTKNQPEKLRDVESESGVRISGNKKRADYLFRTNGNSQFICEAKKPITDCEQCIAQVALYLDTRSPRGADSDGLEIQNAPNRATCALDPAAAIRLRLGTQSHARGITAPAPRDCRRDARLSCHADFE